MSTLWPFFILVVMLVVLLIRDSLTDLCKEEVRTRLTQLPHAILRIAALRLPREVRNDACDEWHAELEYILRDTDGLPLTRLVKGLYFSASMVRIVLPSASLTNSPRLSFFHRLVKSSFDRMVALTVLTMYAPLLLMIAFVIWIEDGRPIFERQTQVGHDGKAFTMRRFRVSRREVSPTSAHAHKPRGLSRVGGTLSRYSIDALPVMFSVVRGDMSLVGSRSRAAEIGNIRPEHRAPIKAGLTGLWLVAGRELSDMDMIRLDYRYAANWSFMLDLQIIWKTLSSAVSRGQSPYASE